MILTVQIDKLEPGTYEAHVLVDGVEARDAITYTSLEAAIAAEAEWAPPELAQFMEVRYHGVSSGTYACEEMRGQAAKVADRIIAVIAQMHQAQGH